MWCYQPPHLEGANEQLRNHHFHIWNGMRYDVILGMIRYVKWTHILHAKKVHDTTKFQMEIILHQRLTFITIDAYI